LKITSDKENEVKTIDSIGYKTKHSSVKSILDENTLFTKKLMQLGFYHFQELENKKENDSVFRFHYSIDAHGEHNDYIRYPSKWEHQEEVFWKLDNTAPQVEVTTATTIMALNIAYIPEFVQWKVNQGFKKINKWPLGAGGINMHFAYWPPQLNVKVLPQHIKKQISNKYENEFYPWIDENWNKFTGIKENNISKEQFLENPYGIKRYKGIVNFMNAEDWSTRLPETKEYLQLINTQRGWNDKFLKVFPIFKDIINE
jgi:hypothetical protein